MKQSAISATVTRTRASVPACASRHRSARSSSTWVIRSMMSKAKRKSCAIISASVRVSKKEGDKMKVGFRWTVLALVAFVVGGLVSTNAQAAGDKIGYVDLARVFDEYNKTK